MRTGLLMSESRKGQGRVGIGDGMVQAAFLLGLLLEVGYHDSAVTCCEAARLLRCPAAASNALVTRAAWPLIGSWSLRAGRWAGSRAPVGAGTALPGARIGGQG